jgi:hypothetical protein
MDREGLAAEFVTENTTISVGVSGGHCFGPRDYSPKESEFIERRIVSRGHRLEAAVQGSVTPTVSARYSQGGGTSVEMIPSTVGLWPADFGSGVEGYKRWRYNVLESYKTNLECSSDCPPVHRASFLYDGTSPDNFPSYLHLMVKNEFRLAKKKRYTLKDIKSNIMRPPIRHISLLLEARIQRTGSRDYYEIPSPEKKGAILEAQTEFDQRNIGLLRTVAVRETKPCGGIEAGLSREINRSR